MQRRDLQRRDLQKHARHGGGADAGDRPDPEALAPPERITLGTQVYDALRDLLIAGGLAPGERLSLRTVAERLGTSMMPAREAVSRLVADEALEVLPNRAVRVPVIIDSTTVRTRSPVFTASSTRDTLSSRSRSSPRTFSW